MTERKSLTAEPCRARGTCYCPRCRPVVVARYDGAPCPVCSHRVLAYDWITTVDGETWLHEDCAPGGEG